MDAIVAAPDHVRLLHELRRTAQHLYSLDHSKTIVSIDPPVKRCEAFDTLVRRNLVGKETYYAANEEWLWEEYEAWVITKEGLALLAAYGR